MERPNLLENGNIPPKRKFSCCQVALVFIFIIISALVSVVICLLHLNQAVKTCWAHGYLKKPSNSNDPMLWNWDLRHCDGFVHQDRDQYLVIEQSGIYFIYAQVHRMETIEMPFTVELYKEPHTSLNMVVGPTKGDKKVSVNFGRPVLLQKGDTLCCKVNFQLKSIDPGIHTYWGLYKI